MQQPLKWWCHRFFLLPYMHQHHRHYHQQHEYLWPGALRIDEIVTEGSRMVPCYEGPAEKAPTGNLLLRLWWVLLVTLQMLLTTWLSKLQLVRFALLCCCAFSESDANSWFYIIRFFSRSNELLGLLCLWQCRQAWDCKKFFFYSKLELGD